MAGDGWQAPPSPVIRQTATRQDGPVTSEINDGRCPWALRLPGGSARCSLEEGHGGAHNAPLEGHEPDDRYTAAAWLAGHPQEFSTAEPAQAEE